MTQIPTAKLALTVNTATYAWEQGRFVREDSLTAAASACFRPTGEGWCLLYSERDENGSTSTQLIYRQGEGSLTLSRQGAFDYTLLLKKDVPCPFLYRVPPAAFDGEATLLSCQGSLSLQGGSLTLTYLLTIGGARRKIRLTLQATP